MGPKDFLCCQAKFLSEALQDFIAFVKQFSNFTYLFSSIEI